MRHLTLSTMIMASTVESGLFGHICLLSRMRILFFYMITLKLIGLLINPNIVCRFEVNWFTVHFGDQYLGFQQFLGYWKHSPPLSRECYDRSFVTVYNPRLWTTNSWTADAFCETFFHENKAWNDIGSQRQRGLLTEVATFHFAVQEN